MKRLHVVMVSAALAATLAAPVQAAAVDPADRAAAIAARFDAAGDKLLAFFNRLADRAAARGRDNLADRLRAKGEAANARLDALGVNVACRINPAADICTPAA